MVVGLQVWLLLRQNEIIGEQNAILSDSATIALAHKRIGDNALATQKEIERAYIAMSHSGVRLTDSTLTHTLPSTRRTDDDNPDAIELVVEIANHGRTPGDVLGGFYGFTRNTGAAGPDLKTVFGGGRLSRLFVLPAAKIDFGAIAVIGQGNMGRLISDELTADQKYLWFVGEVDYRDRFGKMHRSMYCRRYSHHAAGLVFGPETGPLNFDRPLTDDQIKQRGYDKDEN